MLRKRVSVGRAALKALTRGALCGQDSGVAVGSKLIEINGEYVKGKAQIEASFRAAASEVEIVFLVQRTDAVNTLAMEASKRTVAEEDGREDEALEDARDQRAGNSSGEDDGDGVSPCLYESIAQPLMHCRLDRHSSLVSRPVGFSMRRRTAVRTARRRAKACWTIRKHTIQTLFSSQSKWQAALEIQVRSCT
eukprot:COSAG06_NODE_677_length_13149_cov_37.657854_15_plen_193_part_00